MGFREIVSRQCVLLVNNEPIWLVHVLHAKSFHYFECWTKKTERAVLIVSIHELRHFVLRLRVTAKLFILGFIVYMCEFASVRAYWHLAFYSNSKVNSSLPNTELKLSHLLCDEHVNLRTISQKHTTFSIRLVNTTICNFLEGSECFYNSSDKLS